MSLIKKLKGFATDYPKEPTHSIAEIAIHKGPVIAIASKASKHCLPFYIRWYSEKVRNDN